MLHRNNHNRDFAGVISYISKSGAFFVLTLIAVFVVLWPIMAIFDHAADFYRSPAVPWRIEVAAFGALVLSMLKDVSCVLIPCTGRPRRNP